MQISISGKNMDTGLAFQEHAELSLSNVIEKYFRNAVSGHVTLEKADSGFTVKTRVALSRRMELESTGRAADAHAALDAAIEHAEKRLRHVHTESQLHILVFHKSHKRASRCRP